MENKPQKWEIWLANVKYEDDLTQVKKRPVLFVGKEDMYLISLKITSHPPRSNFSGEYEIVKWKESGLSKTSTVRVSKKLKLEEKDFVRKLGRLQAYDAFYVGKLLEPDEITNG